METITLPERKHSVSKTVLVVEDDEGILSSLCEVLGYLGCSVEAARNGREGLDRLRQSAQAPCLILLDLFMPVMDGWEFIDHLKDGDFSEDRKAIPVVVISAAGDRGRRAVERASEYLIKPIELETLTALVKKYCGAIND